MGVEVKQYLMFGIELENVVASVLRLECLVVRYSWLQPQVGFFGGNNQSEMNVFVLELWSLLYFYCEADSLEIILGEFDETIC